MTYFFPDLEWGAWTRWIHPRSLSEGNFHIIKEYVSPAQELNLTAKLLSKFINSANKRIFKWNLDLKDTQNNEEVEKKSKNQMVGLSEEKD